MIIYIIQCCWNSSGSDKWNIEAAFTRKHKAEEYVRDAEALEKEKWKYRWTIKEVELDSFAHDIDNPSDIVYTEEESEFLDLPPGYHKS